MINDKIIVALDTQNEEKLNFLLSELKGNATYVKVGMELFYTYGPDIVRKMKDLGFKVFLDLKLHDIPQTVHNACMTLAKLDVDILNVHAAGGMNMMRQALTGYREYNENGLLIGVTQLTSTDQETLNQQIGIEGDLNQAIIKYAKLTRSAGLGGVVCSPKEIRLVKENCSSEFICVTPGIRPRGTESHDQKRVMTPKEAIENGVDHMVIGRAITQAISPKESYLKILEEIS
jgi:orotidine-5'-phosphate decarboxylase